MSRSQEEYFLSKALRKLDKKSKKQNYKQSKNCPPKKIGTYPSCPKGFAAPGFCSSGVLHYTRAISLWGYMSILFIGLAGWFGCFWYVWLGNSENTSTIQGKKDIFGLYKSGLGVILNFSVNSFPYYSLGQLAGLVAFGTFGWLI